MNITRHNYEEFFLLYVDNELSATDRKAVEEFAEQHPDLQEELTMLQQSMFRPDEEIVFDNKESLLQPMTEQSGINGANYESFFVLYADDELTNSEKAAVEEFVYRNPPLQEEFELLQQVKLQPDTSIVFAGKENLYRKEEDDKVVVIRWWRWAAAAILLLIAGLLWMTNVKKEDNSLANGAKPAQTTPSATQKENETVHPQKINEQPQQENMAAADDKIKDGNQQADAVKKSTDIQNTARQYQQQVAVTKKTTTQHSKDIIKEQEPVIAQVTDNNDKLKGASLVAGTTDNHTKIETRPTAITGSTKIEIIDKPTDDSYANSKENIQWASSGDENVEVLNTTVNKQNSLRGFFRKASRLIAKKTNLSDGDRDHKGILIGGFEIAVK